MRGMAERLFPISNAKVQCFNRCRKQFWFKYVSGLPWPDSPMNEAGVIGTGVHRAMSVLTETDDVDIGISELDAYLRMPVHELAGPEPTTYRDLIRKTGRLLGNDVSVGAVPVWTAKLGAALVSRIRRGGMTPTVIDVITADETVRKNADIDLGVTLTPLSGTLEHLLNNTATDQP